jgi:hypothetical protein
MSHGIRCDNRSPTTLDYKVIAMTKASRRRIRLAPPLLALLCFALLANCIQSTEPILTDGQPLLGESPRLQVYVLRDGAAHDPGTETFRWRESRYVPENGTLQDLGSFTLHAFEGADMLVQSIRSGFPSEYAIAHKLADGAYLLAVVDENDADDATRGKFCINEPGTRCRVSTRDGVFALARATAAKRRSTGGLAVLLAEH